MPPTQGLTRVRPLGNVQARKPRVGQASRRVDGEPGCIQLGALHSGKGAELPAAAGHLRCCVGDDNERPTDGDGGVPRPARGYVLPKSCPGSKAGGEAGCHCLHLLCAGQASRCSARTRCYIHQADAAGPRPGSHRGATGAQGGVKLTACTTESPGRHAFRENCAGNTRLRDRPLRFEDCKSWRRSGVLKLPPELVGPGHPSSAHSSRVSRITLV
jgi:hypothetical protein